MSLLLTESFQPIVSGWNLGLFSSAANLLISYNKRINHMLGKKDHFRLEAKTIKLLEDLG